MKIRNINDWMLDPSIQEPYQKAIEREEVSSQLAEAIHQVKQTTKNLDTYPDLTTEMILTIEDVGYGGEGPDDGYGYRNLNL